MTELRDLLYSLCNKYPEGLTQARINGELAGKDVDKKQILLALNGLIDSGDVKVLQRKQADGATEVVFKAVQREDREKFRGLSSEDMLVYQQIKASKDHGIWSRELKYKTGLQSMQITKSLKILESRKIIKCVHAVSAKTKKVYMLYEIEPSRELTGGAWYSGSELDEDLINVLHDQCYVFISQKGYASAEAVHSYVQESGVFKVELRVDDVVTVLNTLVFDGLIESFRDPRAGTAAAESASGLLYKPSRLKLPVNAFTSVPCAMCPVASSCAPDSTVTPATCPYLQEWLR